MLKYFQIEIENDHILKVMLEPPQDWSLGPTSAHLGKQVGLPEFAGICTLPYTQNTHVIVEHLATKAKEYSMAQIVC
jgi:hypothetical protein